MTAAETFLTRLQGELSALQDAGLYKTERVLTTPQGAVVRTSTGAEVINLCANNYLGLAAHPRVVAAAQAAMASHGFGHKSVLRFRTPGLEGLRGSCG